MNTRGKNNKRTIILLGVLIVLVAVWFSTRPSNEGEIVVGEQSAVGESALVLLAQIESIDFDFTVLKSAEFQALINRTLPLPNLPIGRQNPFAPAP